MAFNADFCLMQAWFCLTSNDGASSLTVARSMLFCAPRSVYFLFACALFRSGKPCHARSNRSISVRPACAITCVYGLHSEAGICLQVTSRFISP